MSYQDDINLNAKLFVRQRIISGTEATSILTGQDSAGIVIVNTTVLHTVTLPPAMRFPKGFFTRYIAPNATTRLAPVVLVRTAPDTINLKTEIVTLSTNDSWVLLVSDGASNWSAFKGV